MEMDKWDRTIAEMAKINEELDSLPHPSEATPAQQSRIAYLVQRYEACEQMIAEMRAEYSLSEDFPMASDDAAW